MPRKRIIHAGIVRLFADRLKELRHSRNLTQAELAHRALVPASYISDLEKAKVAPGIDLVDRLATALETTVTDLLPSSVATETPAALRTQARQLLEEIFHQADQDVLFTLRSLLLLLRELSTRRR